ncbi:MAG: LysM peptidoglycan-binding domain-containing protein [Actinobacteria bacterium]|nr:LysM peptidoglycan-binding domain-containing protein [Actinomycetota bacterium]
MRAIVPVAVLLVIVALAAALAGAGLFGGNAREEVGTGPTDTEVVITFTPAEMTGAARTGAEVPTPQLRATTTTGAESTTTTPSTPADGSGASDSPSSSTTISRRTTSTAHTTKSTAHTTTSAPATYVVQPGDTPASIAEKLGVSTAELMRLNGIADPTNLAVGAVLKVPAP